MADMFGNSLENLNKNNQLNRNNQSEYETDMFGNPTSVLKPQKPFYTPKPTLTSLEKIAKLKPISKNEITNKPTLPLTENKLKETNKAVKGLKSVLNFAKDSINETGRQVGIASNAALAQAPQKIMSFYARNQNKLPSALRLPFTEEQIKADFTPRKLSEGGIGDYIAEGIGYVAGGFLGGAAAKSLTSTKGLASSRVGSLSPKLKELDSKKLRILDSIKEGAKAEAIYSSAQTAGNVLFNSKDLSTVQEFKNLGLNLGIGGVGNAVGNEILTAVIKKIDKNKLNKIEINKVKEEIIKPIEEINDNVPTLNLVSKAKEKKDAISDITEISNASKKRVRNSKKSNLQKQTELKEISEETDLDKRRIVQGEYLISVKDGLTMDELQNKIFNFLTPKIDDVITFENQPARIISIKRGIAELELPDKTIVKQFADRIDKQDELIKLMTKQSEELNLLDITSGNKLITNLINFAPTSKTPTVETLTEVNIPKKNKIIYKKNDSIIHNKFGSGNILGISDLNGENLLEIEFLDGNIKYIKENSTAISLVKKTKTSKAQSVIQSALDKNLQDIEDARNSGTTRLYSSLIPLPSKLQQLYVKRGALYIAKGVVEFSEWSKLMIADLGSSVSPYLKKIFKDSLSKSNNIISDVEKSLESSIKSEKLRASAKGKLREQQVPVTISRKGNIPTALTDKTRKEARSLGNQQTLEAVQNDLNENGVYESYKTLLKSGEPSAYNTVMALRLTDEFQKIADNFRRQGKFEDAKLINQDIVDLIDDLRDKLNNAGQATQAMVLYNKLDENGILLFVEKQISKLNKKQGTTNKLNKDEIQNVTDIARSIKKTTGIENIGNRVLDIIDESKKRELTTSELQEVSNFVNDSNVFVKETMLGTNKYKSDSYTQDIVDAVLPKQMSSPDVKTEVENFIAKHADESKKNIKNLEKQKDMTPLDVYSDYVVIGVSKIIKFKNFDEWSAAMVKELGDSVKPYLKDLFFTSKKALKNTVEKIIDPEIKKIIKGLNFLLNKQKLSIKDFQEARELAKEISKLSGDSKREALDDLEVFINSKSKSSLGEKLSSYTRISQLLNPKTLLKNGIGNEIFYRIERLSKYISTPIDIGASKLFGTKRTVTFKLHNQESFWKNWLKGLSAGYKGTTLQYNLGTQFDLGRFALQSVPILKYLEKSLSAALYSFDFAAYKRATGNVVSEMATLNAINNNIDLSKMSTPELQNYYENFARNANEAVTSISEQYGKYITFQDENVISRLLQKAKTFLNKLSPIKDFGAGNMIINYPKTPGALVMRALEYSPAGILRSLYHLSLFIAKNPKVPTQRKAVEDLTRAFIGTTGLTALGWFGIENGILLPGRNKNYSKAELDKQAGILGNELNYSALKRFVESGFKQKQEIKPNDIIHTYDWLQPLSLSIMIGAESKTNSIKKQKEQKSLFNLGQAAFEAIIGGSQSIVEQPLLQNLQSFLTIYPGDTTEQLLIDKPLDILKSIPAALTPTMFNQLRIMSDNSVRETYDPNFFKTSIKKSIAKIPILSSYLPKKYDTLGNLKKSYQESSIKNKFGKTSVDLLNIFLNPSFTTRYKPTEEAAFILDLIDKTNDDTLSPVLLSKKSITLPKIGDVKPNLILSGNQYSELQKLTGEKVRNSILGLKQANLTDKEKAKILERILTKSYSDSKIELLIKYKNEFTKQVKKGE
jgi:hypothetical protein